MTGLNSLVALGKAALTVGGMLQSDFTKQQRDWTDACLAEANQIGTAVAVALVSLAKGRAPTDPEVQEFLRSIVEDAAAPARMRRLLTEAFNSPTRERRARIAAVLFGGPKVAGGDAERDRLDSLVVQLNDEDVETLRSIYLTELPIAGSLSTRKESTAQEHGRIALVTHDQSARWSIILAQNFGKEVVQPCPSANPVSITALDAVGCIETRPKIWSPDSGDIGSGRNGWTIRVVITPLGRFLIGALKLLNDAAARNPIGDDEIADARVNL